MSDGLRQVPKEKIERLFKIVRLDPERQKQHPNTPHQWFTNKTEAERQLGMSRPTIDKWLDQYGKTGISPKAKKTEPAYFHEFAQSDCAKKLIENYYDREIKGLNALGQNHYSTLREAWKARNKKDPLTFDLQDYLFFWGVSAQAPYAAFTDPMTNKIQFNKAVALRWSMKYGRAKDLVDDPRFTTKGLKRDPQKKHFYLEDFEIIKLATTLPTPDSVVLVYCGVLMGGRFSSLGGIENRKHLGLKVEDIHRQSGFLTLKEVKVGETIEKDLFDFTLEFIWQYVIDYGIADDNSETAKRTGAAHKLFSWDMRAYNEILSRTSREVGLPENKIMTSHMMKHTCITQMGLHGIDIDVISDYVGTDADTIMKFYRGGGRDKIRSQILDLPRHQETWKQFVQRIHPYFMARYKSLKDQGIATIFGAKPKGAA